MSLDDVDRVDRALWAFDDAQRRADKKAAKAKR